MLLGDDDGPVAPPHPGTSRAVSAKSTMRPSDDNRLLLDWLSERLRVIMRNPTSFAHRVDASTLVETHSLKPPDRVMQRLVKNYVGGLVKATGSAKGPGVSTSDAARVG